MAAASPLQERVRAFLKRPIPPEAGPVQGSMAEGFLATYAAEGPDGIGADAAELVELCIAESEAVADGGSPAEQAYFRESAALLESILRGIPGAP